MSRKLTRKVMVGTVPIGGGAPISVQSMTKTQTKDVRSTIRQIKELVDVDCDIVRVAVPDEESAKSIKEIKKSISIPIVADIHFKPELAIESIRYGADKIRINPGTAPKNRLESVIDCASDRGIPIRIGINAGSLETSVLRKYGKPTSEALVESALSAIDFFEKKKFCDLVISVKSTDIKTTVEAYRTLSQRIDYPLHLGITEAGMSPEGVVRSSIGVGILLAEGIGDTIRISLTGSPVEEVIVAREILKALSLREGLMLYSCPTCARCEIDIESMVKEVRTRIRNLKKAIRIAIMGCTVNGPGEAKEADLGIAGGKGFALLFKKGTILRKVPEADIVNELLEELERL